MNTSLTARILLTTVTFSSVMPFMTPAFAGGTSSVEKVAVHDAKGYLVADSLVAQQRRSRERLNNSQVRQLVDRISSRTDSFRERFGQALDNSRLNGTQREDNINQALREFKRATDSLRDSARKRESLNGKIQDVLNRASRIDSFMQRRRLGGNVEREWALLRRDLNQLSRYDSDYGSCLNDDQQVRRLLDRLETDTVSFRDRLDEVLDDSRLNGTQWEDSINQAVREFDQAIDNLRDSLRSDRVDSDDVEVVLNRGARIDNFVRRRRLGSEVEREWAKVSRDLNEISQASNRNSNDCL